MVTGPSQDVELLNSAGPVPQEEDSEEPVASVRIVCARRVSAPVLISPVKLDRSRRQWLHPQLLVHLTNLLHRQPKRVLVH